MVVMDEISQLAKLELYIVQVVTLVGKGIPVITVLSPSVLF